MESCVDCIYLNENPEYDEYPRCGDPIWKDVSKDPGGYRSIQTYKCGDKQKPRPKWCHHFITVEGLRKCGVYVSKEDEEFFRQKKKKMEEINDPV